MRKDMAKVIVERPRAGGKRGNSPRATYKYRGDDDNYVHPPQSRKVLHQYNSKDLNENLQPLRRWLDKQVNRPWDKVYSEICEHVSKDSACQLHILQHVRGYVATHQGVDAYYYDYIVDSNGILRKNHRWWRSRRVKADPKPEHKLAENTYADCINGCWYEVTYEWQTKNYVYNMSDYGAKARRNRHAIRKTYPSVDGLRYEIVQMEEYLVPVSKRALNSKAIKRMGLAA